MKKHNGWAYAPYQPHFMETDLYICRVIPTDTSVSFDWLDSACERYEVFFKRLEEEEFHPYTVTDATHCEIDGLETGIDYAFYIASGNKKSSVRLARTGKVHGTPVNYLHPEDKTYQHSGKCLCSPCLIRHPDGYLLASMDVFEVYAPQNLALIFRSDDDGKTWQYVSELFPCFWPRMFIHRGVLYVLGCSTEYGDLLIGASYDGGKTFTEPTILYRGTNGKNKMPGVHKNPQPVVEYNGRLYNTMEWGSWGLGYHAAMVMSVDADADLLCADNWSFTKPVLYDPTWKGVAHGPSSGNIEGCLVVGRDGKLYSVMRYDMAKTEEGYGLVLRYRVNTEDPEAPLEYERAIQFPANHSKFQIRYDEVSDMYFSIASRITRYEDRGKRTLLSLMASKDMLEWVTVCDLIDERENDPTGKKLGFQYVDFFYEGDDILYLCRTGMNGAANFHDTNYITFHRVPKFRDMLR